MWFLDHRALCTKSRVTSHLELAVNKGLIIDKSDKVVVNKALIIGKSDEVSGYGVYIPGNKVVAVNQHLKNVDILTKKQNDQLRKAHLKYDAETASKGPAQKVKTQASVQAKIRQIAHEVVAGHERLT